MMCVVLQKEAQYDRNISFDFIFTRLDALPLDSRTQYIYFRNDKDVLA